MRSIYSVEKATTPFGQQKWTVQMPKGLMGFRTKRAAVSFAEGMRREATDQKRVEAARAHIIERMLAE